MTFTSYCRATTDADDPGTNVAATISRFSASAHDRCRRRSLKLVSITELVDTSHHRRKNRTVPHPAKPRKAAHTGGRPTKYRRLLQTAKIAEIPEGKANLTALRSTLRLKPPNRSDVRRVGFAGEPRMTERGTGTPLRDRQHASLQMLIHPSGGCFLRADP